VWKKVRRKRYFDLLSRRTRQKAKNAAAEWHKFIPSRAYKCLFILHYYLAVLMSTHAFTCIASTPRACTTNTYKCTQKGILYSCLWMGDLMSSSPPWSPQNGGTRAHTQLSRFICIHNCTSLHQVRDKSFSAPTHVSHWPEILISMRAVAAAGDLVYLHEMFEQPRRRI
jgi:hypothetical protein